MSHFTEIETKLKCFVTIQKAVEEMGYVFKEGVQHVRGYRGQLTEAIAVIDTKASIDIGVVKTQTGYALIADWEMLEVRAGIEQEVFVKQLNRTYARLKILEEVEKHGYSVIEEEENEEQVVTVRLRRWT